MIRVFIADDQLLVRQGIRALLELEDSIAIVGEAADGVQTIERVPALAVDTLLLDIRMPRKRGIDVLHELSAKKILPPTLIPTTFDDSNAVPEGLRGAPR